VEYSFDVSAYPAFIRTDINYRGEAESDAQEQEMRTNGDYILVGLRAGINIDQWELALYGKNLLNEDTVINYENRISPRLLRPRKLGISVKYAF